MSEVKKTHIMLRANLKHRLLQGYLDLLLEKGLLEVFPSEETPVYQTTGKDHAFYSKYMELSKM